ncbi:hypothetical protein C0989_004703 [Termitomyces sp. Mn162]|nr:hypothetical protein C0989_004703 [Termitomyces sp. Mn162]
MQSTTLVVAFLLKADITNHILDTLVEAVATKTIDKIGALVDKLGLTADFLTANDMKQAESTLKLQATSATLEGVYTLLDALASKLVSSPPVPAPSLSWASVAMPMPPNLIPFGLQPTLPSNNQLLLQEMLSVQQ